MTVLITGASGQLGCDLGRRLPDARGLSREELDIADEAAVERALAGVDLVFNCAAYNAVDDAETHPELARRANQLGPATLASACLRRGAKLVHFSTNYVFDGRSGQPYTEDDLPAPEGVYGRSKLEGERAVLAAYPGALVIRSSGLFGSVGSAIKGGSFPERIVRAAREGRELKVVSDQFLNPTWTGDLAEASIALARGDLQGVVHLVAQGCASYHELAVACLKLAGLAHLKVAEVTSEEFAARAPRPKNGCLGSLRVPPLRPWREGLRAFWEEYEARLGATGR